MRPESSGSVPPSAWPLTIALGVAGIYGTAAVARLGDRLRPGVLAPIAVVALTLLAVGGGGWLLGRRGSNATDGGLSRAADLAVWVALCVDAMTFATALLCLLWLWASPLPLGSLPPLHPRSLTVATLVLVSSSATLHVARRASTRGDDRTAGRYLDATLVLGALFLAGRAGEYHSLLGAGYTLTTSHYSTALYGLTALHGLHVLAGLGALFGLRLGDRSAGSPATTALVPVARYWHFLGVVWLLLVATLYLGVRVVP